MTEPDNFISVYDEKSNPIDILYPFVSGLPMHPSKVIKLHNKGEFFFRCAHGMICEAWYIGLNSANEHRGCAFIRCPKQINHRCGLYVKLNDIYITRKPPTRWNLIHLRLSLGSGLPPQPNFQIHPRNDSRRSKHKLPLPPFLHPFQSSSTHPQLTIHQGPTFYYHCLKTMVAFCQRPVMTIAQSPPEIVSFFTELCDAMVGPKGAVIYDKTKQSQGTFSLTSIDIEILIKQLRGAIFNPRTRMEELECHELRLNQQELRLKLKAFKGAGVGPDNQMIGPSEPAFFATGSSKEDPIDMDYYLLPLLKRLMFLL
ncbi:hypothetical protein EV359DRAFT_66688 [Lentinula novae-zelandiae]|nr:hypothetical protein EV359DRAFT_66688 [Lentinula novae-zelandiae]